MSEVMEEAFTEAVVAERKKPGRKPGVKRTQEVGGMPVHDVSADSGVEIAYWNSVQGTKNRDDLHEYLERWPEGNFAAIAERRIMQLDQWDSSGRQGEASEIPAHTPIPKVANLPHIPMRSYAHGDQIPRYKIMDYPGFFAENDTLYPEGMEIDYIGPPGEGMMPLNEAGRLAKAEQEEYLDICHNIKCQIEGKPLVPRPKELADQIETARRQAQLERGVIEAQGAAPSRPDLAKTPTKNPRAHFVGNASNGNQTPNDRTSVGQRPVLGREGDRYQRTVNINDTAP